MREDEDRLVERRVVAPPALPRIGAPRSACCGTELASAHDLSANVGVTFGYHRVAGVLLAAFDAVRLEPFLEVEHPLVELLAANAERLLLGLVGPGHVAVERNGDVRSYLAHEPRIAFRAWIRIAGSTASGPVSTVPMADLAVGSIRRLE